VRALTRCLVVVGVLGVLGTGCASHDRPDADPTPSASPSAQAPDDCSSHIDTLIEAKIVPSSDREYAYEMCERNR